jgi:F0F1-type ATP synthase alpha subunit
MRINVFGAENDQSVLRLLRSGHKICHMLHQTPSHPLLTHKNHIFTVIFEFCTEKSVTQVGLPSYYILEVDSYFFELFSLYSLLKTQ